MSSSNADPTLFTLPLMHALMGSCPGSLSDGSAPHAPNNHAVLSAVLQGCRMMIEELHAKGVSEASYTSPVAHLGPETTGVVHIGAHRGQEAPWYAARVGRNVVWIECNPSVLPSLEANVGGYGHTVVQACLWNVAGEVRQFHLTSNDAQSASIVGNLTEESKVMFSGLQGSETQGVVTMTTTDWPALCKEHPMLANEKYNFLVVDAQGAEYEILEAVARPGGAEQGLAQFTRLLVEYSNNSIYEGQRLQPDVESLLAQHGFVNKHKFYPPHGDVLYVRQAPDGETAVDASS
jgi:FkbM family methyltransferase